MTDPRAPYQLTTPALGELASRSDGPGLGDLFRDPLDPGYADAARRRGDTPVRWRHGRRAIFVIAMVSIGLLLAVAYRQVVAEEPTRSQVRADLETQIHERQEATDRLEAAADVLRDEVAQLRDQQLAGPDVQRLRELEAATGLGRVSGDGVVVRVEDGPPGVDPATGAPVMDPQARILDLDLQQIANGLWAAGAEAVAINDQRLTATSTIRSASGAILIDRRPVAGPYEVVAIGPDDLERRFTASPADELMRELADDYGIAYQVRSQSDLTLPAAAAPKLQHAIPGGNP